jgi:AhpD family alkylhydroperoxidase
MPRIPLITERSAELSDEQLEVYDHVTGSRGRMIRPYEVALHAPGLARPMSELGAEIRYHSTLSDHDRELAIMTTAALTGCAFEWESHHSIALEAGVRPDALAHIRGETIAELDAGESTIVDFVRQLHESASVDDASFAAAESALNSTGVVELASLVGYYTMLAYVMGAVDAC